MQSRPAWGICWPHNPEALRLSWWHLYEPLDEVAADRLEQLIADAIAHRTRTEPGLEL